MKTGFTLIELLAVIVILAIIALIATPIVLNIINNAKESSDEQSVELYKDTVEKTITKKQLSDPNFNPDKCKIQENGNLKCYKNNELFQDEIEVDMKGRMPTKGTVILRNNKITFTNILFNGKIYYEKYAVLINDEDGDGKVSLGDKYEYEVNDKDAFNFYVLSFNEEYDTVNLIMDRNICGSEQSNDPINGILATEENSCLVKWSSYDNRYGPIVAMKSLYNATKNWKNVPNMDLSGDKAIKDETRIYFNNTYGYDRIETTETGISIFEKDGVTEVIVGTNQTPIIPYEEGKSLKARLPGYNEITNQRTKCVVNSDIRCEFWLADNLEPNIEYPKTIYPKKKNILGIKGYWLISSGPNMSNTGSFMSSNGFLSSSLVNYANAGIRPVITVPRSYLES